MPAANRRRAGGGAFAGRSVGATSRSVPAPIMGDLALGLGLLLLRPAALDGHADDRIPQLIEPIAHDFDEPIRVAHIDNVARWLWLDGTFSVAFERKLTRAAAC
jgi:hypothetical protein